MLTILSIIIFLIVLVAVALYWQKRAPVARKNDLINLALFLASLVFCAILMEIGLRFFSPTSLFHPHLALVPHQKRTIKVDLNGVSPVIHHSTNEWGLRGDPIPPDWKERPTILTVGGSTTQCFYLSDENTWPALLQAELRQYRPNLIVQNAGLDGHSSRGHLLLLQNVIPKIKPKMVVILLGINDLGLSLLNPSSERTNPFENTSLRYKIFSKSRLMQWLFKWHKVLLDKAPVVQERVYQNRDIYSREPITNPSPLPVRLEEVLPTLPSFKSNVQAMIQFCRQDNIEMLWMTQPLLFDSGPPWDNLTMKSYWLKGSSWVISDSTFWNMLTIFNQTLIQICEENEVSCLDLASKVPHSIDYFYDAAHFNEAGAQLVAKETASFLSTHSKYIHQ